MLQLQNVEQRRVAIPLLSYSELAGTLEVVDKSPTLGAELCTPCPALAETLRQRAKWLRLQCPTTGRIYLEAVPDYLQSVDAAWAWQFGFREAPVLAAAT